MPRKCAICHHPDRTTIEQAAATARSIAKVADRFGVKRDALYRHMKLHLAPEKRQKLTHGVPDEVEVDVDKMTREAGQYSIIGLKQLAIDLQQTAEKCDRLNDFANATKARAALAAVYKEQARLGGLYPGLKGTTNNNLIVADDRVLFDLFDKILTTASSVPEARRMLAAAYRQEAELPALKGQVIDAP